MHDFIKYIIICVQTQTMKLLLFCCILVLAVIIEAVTEEQRAKLRKVSDECKAEVGTDTEALQKFKTGQIPADATLKKHVLCASKKVGLVKESGKIDGDRVRNRLEKANLSGEELETAYNLCVVEKSTPEDTATDLVLCLGKNVPNFIPVD